ncbi:hypothetical protein KZX50_09335 [Bacillus infantis]|nr:hypothetical protein [Bacillus infantis]OXT18219.1 hypothetical protein B9K06_06855 [Bacillus sp. OG2]
MTRGRIMMHQSETRLEKLLGQNITARHQGKEYSLDHYFQQPIVHKQINGDKVYVPLNLERVWNQPS